MRLSRLYTIFSRTNVFYPIVAVAIVVPNVALGAYGYWAIRHAQEQAEQQVQAAYQSVVQHVNERVTERIFDLERTIIARVPPDLMETDGWELTPETPLPLEADAPLALAADWALAHGQQTAVLHGYYLVKQRELVTPPTIRRALAGATDATEAGPRGHAERSAAAADAETVARWRYFTEHLWPQVRSQLGGTRHLPLHVPPTQEFHTVLLLGAVPVGDRHVVGVAWFDLDQLERVVVAPLLASIRLPHGRLVLMPDRASRPNRDSLLVVQRCDQAIVPHWWIGVEVRDGISAFRHASQVGATVNLALLAIFMPFIAVGAVLMIRALVKDIREARQKTDFVSRVTHELKTPLTSIRLFIETLQMGGAQSQEEIKRCLDIIQQESERLSKLIERVLDFSKMEMGNKVFHFREDDIETVVRDTIDFFRKQAMQKGAVIRLYIERNLPRFEFDRDAVREVLLNLLENAIKYSVGEKLAAIRLTRTRWRNQDAVQIQVIDNGVGIRREDMPRIFDQFYRVDDTLTKGIDGSGLGLTLSREIARAHAGDILVESQQGRGSKFTLVLPLHARKP